MQGHSGFSFECIQRTDCKCFGPPVAIRIGQSSSIDAPTLLFTAKSTNTAQIYPSVTLTTACPKRSTTKSSYSIPMLQNPLQEIFVPPLWQPPSTTYCHRSSQDHTRPALLAPASILIYIISYFQRQFCSLFCTIQNRDFLDYHRLLLLTDMRPCPCS